MRRIRVLLLACYLASSTTAGADSVEIDFDLGNSVVSLLGTANVPPDGTINSMSATAVFPAIQTVSGATSIQTGSAQLKNVTLDMTVNAGATLVGLVTGTIIVAQVGTATGPFTNTQSVMLGGGGTGTGGGLSLFISAHLDCAGLFCGGIGDFPISVYGTSPSPPGEGFTLSLAYLNVPGSAGVGGTIPISIPPATTYGSPFTGAVVVMGSEVSRTFSVPEPAILLQLVPGVIALVGLSKRRRRIPSEC